MSDVICANCGAPTPSIKYGQKCPKCAGEKPAAKKPTPKKPVKK
jgi:hypothetical protein